MVGRSKGLDGLPQFWVEYIQKYANMVTAAALSKSKVVKAHFSRGEKFFEKQYVNIGSNFTKQPDDFFCFKDVCGGRLRKQNRIIFVTLTKANGSVAPVSGWKDWNMFSRICCDEVVIKWVIYKTNKIQ